MTPSRHVLVTGTARGLGRAMALHLAAPGTTLFLHHRGGGEAIQELAREAEVKGARAVCLAAELAEPAERERLVAALAEETDALQVLINNVGLYRPTPLLEQSAEEWRTPLEVTGPAVFHLIQLAAPLLRKGAPARIDNRGDSGNDRVRARDQAVPYHIAKLGVNVITRSFAKALGPDGITVNQISPGILENSLDGPDSSIPAGRRGRFADVLAALDFLLSAEAEYVSGANLTVSGGWNL